MNLFISIIFDVSIMYTIYLPIKAARLYEGFQNNQNHDNIFYV